MFLAEIEPVGWFALLIQAGGAVSVCGMFLWFLTRQKNADDQARNEFLTHLKEKDTGHIEYLKERDNGSREVAREGYQALHSVANQIVELRETIIKNSNHRES